MDNIMDNDHIDSNYGWWLFCPYMGIVLFTGLFAVPVLIFALLALLSLVYVDPTPATIGIIGALLFYVFLWLLLIQRLWRDYPMITIDRSGIRLRTWFGKTAFLWESLSAINLFEESVSENLLGSSRNDPIVTLVMRDGRHYAMALSNCYRNVAALIQVLDQARALLAEEKNVGSALRFKPVFLPQPDESPDSGTDTVFARPHWLSGRGLLFYGLNLFALYTVFHEPPLTLEKLATALVLHLFSWIIGYAFYYFESTDQHLIVRHHLILGYRKVFLWQNIRSVAVYDPVSKATGLRVILEDFRIYDYPAGSLSRADWESLEQTFIEKGFGEELGSF